MEITSNKNPKIREVLHLREKKERDETGLFLIEGYRELSRAVLGNVQFVSFFYARDLFLGENEDALLEKIKAPHYSLPKELFEKISYRDRPDGLLAVARQMNKTLLDLPKKENSFLLIAEAIEKPGNLGTILRSSDGVGVDAVIVVDRCTDIYNPNVVRASVGTLFTIPVIEARGEEVLSYLKKEKIRLVASSPTATTVFTSSSLQGPIAIAVGSEQLGLSPRWMKEADLLVSIPMKGVADSLNVGAATTLLLYEALRQRG